MLILAVSEDSVVRFNKTSSTRGEPSSIASNSESNGLSIPSISKSKGENEDDDNIFEQSLLLPFIADAAEELVLEPALQDVEVEALRKYRVWQLC